jgi:hypothetical protein
VDVFDVHGKQNCTGTPKTCQPLWRVEGDTGSGAHVGIAWDGTYAYVPSRSGLMQLSATTGRTVAGSFGEPLVAEGQVWHGTVAYNASDLSGPIRTITPRSSIGRYEALANGVVYTVTGDGTIAAFDAAGVTNCGGTPKTCSPLWTFRGKAGASAATVANGMVAVDFDTAYGRGICVYRPS